MFDGSHGDHTYEIILDMFLLLLLVWFLNRETEYVTRLAFYGDLQASTDQM